MAAQGKLQDGQLDYDLPPSRPPLQARAVQTVPPLQGGIVYNDNRGNDWLSGLGSAALQVLGAMGNSGSAGGGNVPRGTVYAPIEIDTTPKAPVSLKVGGNSGYQGITNAYKQGLTNLAPVQVFSAPNIQFGSPNNSLQSIPIGQGLKGLVGIQDVQPKQPPVLIAAVPQSFPGYSQQWSDANTANPGQALIQPQQHQFAQQLQQWGRQRQSAPQQPLQLNNNTVPNHLIAESGAVSMRSYHAAKSLPVGEQAIGPQSHFPPKNLIYRNDSDLARQIYQHFVIGEGRPIEIGLEKLNFSRYIDVRSNLPASLRLRLLVPLDTNEAKRDDQNLKALRQAVGNQGKVLGHNNKLTVLEMATALRKDLDINPNDPAKFAAFGKISFDLKQVDLYINHQNQTVVVEGQLHPISQKRPLDKFDFDPAKREWYKELLTQTVHNYAPPGSTSFQIYARKGSYSTFKKVYSFKDFLR